MSSAYAQRPVTNDDGDVIPGLFMVDSQKINKDSGGSVDIGCGGEFGGAGDEAPDETVELVNNVVDESFGFGLTDCPLQKKDLKDFLQTYCKNLRQKLKDDESVPGPEVKKFAQSAGTFCKYLLSKHADMEFFISRSMDPDGSMAFALYVGENANPSFILIEAGLIETKV